MRRILSLKLIITLCLNLVAPAIQCGKRHYKLTHKKNYRHKERKQNYKSNHNKQKRISHCKKRSKKASYTKKQKKNISTTPIKFQKKQRSNRPLNSLAQSCNIHIPKLNKLLFFLTFFIILTPALAECVSGNHRFLIFDNDYDEAINKPPTKLLDEKVECICIKDGYNTQDVLVCNRIYGYSPEVCKSGTKIGVIKGPMLSGYYFKPMVVYIECDCYPDKSMLCFPSSVPDGLEQYGQLSANTQTTTLKTVSQIASITTPVLLVSIGPICAISTCLAAVLYCKYKRIIRRRHKSSEALAQEGGYGGQDPHH